MVELENSNRKIITLNRSKFEGLCIYFTKQKKLQCKVKYLYTHRDTKYILNDDWLWIIFFNVSI